MTHKLPVREPGGSELPPTSPRMLGGSGSSLPSRDVEGGRASGPVLPDEDAGRSGADQFRRSLGRRLRVWRVAVGLSQQQLASGRVGFSRSTVAGVESGRRRAARDFWVRCDAVRGAGGVLVACYRRVVAERERESSGRARKAEAGREERVRQRRAEMGLPDDTVIFTDPPLYY